MITSISITITIIVTFTVTVTITICIILITITLTTTITITITITIIVTITIIMSIINRPLEALAERAEQLVPPALRGSPGEAGAAELLSGGATYLSNSACLSEYGLICRLWHPLVSYGCLNLMHIHDFWKNTRVRQEVLLDT